MLHQENTEVFVKHHSEQLACGNLRGMDDVCSTFLCEKFHIAAVNTAISPSLLASGVKDVTVNHSKRPASIDSADTAEYKRMKQEDQIISEKDDHTTDVNGDVPEYEAYRPFERSFDSPVYESEESEDEGVDSPVHFSLGHAYAEDYLRSASFHQRDDIFSSSLCLIRKTVPIGPNYQAEIPDCTFGKKSNCVDYYGDRSPHSPICDRTGDESEKWIRNCVIPMPGSNELSSTLKPVYYKEDCDCVDEDSIECVKKHVREARESLRDALGPNTFKVLGFCDMGEEVALGWTKKEQHLFQEVVSSNPASLGRNFWDKLPLAFPSKTSKELVSYYFNVFMLRKRAEQNRFDPMNVDSDNDECLGSDDHEFAITQGADKDLPRACNQVPIVENAHEDSDEEDEFDYVSGNWQENYCVEGDVTVSEGCPAVSFVDHTQQTFRFESDVQSDPFTSFEAQQVGVSDRTPTDIAEDHYRNDGFGSVADHGYFGGHCGPKVWGIGFTSGIEKDEFLSTNNVIEEVFGKESSENDFCGDRDII